MQPRRSDCTENTPTLHFASRVFLITNPNGLGTEMRWFERPALTPRSAVIWLSATSSRVLLDPPVRRRIFNLPEDARGSVELKAQQPGDTLNDRDREHNSAFLTPAVGD